MRARAVSLPFLPRLLPVWTSHFRELAPELYVNEPAPIPRNSVTVSRHFFVFFGLYNFPFDFLSDFIFKSNIIHIQISMNK